MLTVMQTKGFYISTAVQTGTDNRNSLGTLGTLSMVTPSLTHEYLNSYDPTDPIIVPWHVGRVARMRVTFMPEPGSTAMMAPGVVALASLYRRRRNLRGR